MLRTLIPCLLAAGAALASPFAGTEVHPLPGDTGLNVALDFPAPSFETIDDREIARLAGEGWLGRPGEPDLPLVNRLVRLPARSGLEVEVLDAAWVSLGWHDIRPEQERLHDESELPLPWIEDEGAYGRAGWYPEHWLTVGEPALVRETRVAPLSVAPLRWNPATGELQRLAHLELLLHFDGESDVNVPLRASDEGASDDDSGLVYRWRQAERAFVGGLLGDRVLNPEAAGAPDADPLEGIDWSGPALPLNYLVFAKATVTDQAAFQAWLDWKRAKGHHVDVVTENDLSGWTTTSIRNEIVDRYTNGAWPPHYVALVGDTGGTYGIPSHSSQYDHYYAAIAGSDILADVVVGRISVENVNQLNAVLNKIVAYEQSPYLVDAGWLRRASFLTGTGHCGLSMSQLSRSIAFDLVEERGYAQIDTAFCASSPSYVYNWINQGISFYNYRGWIGMEGLSTAQLLSLTQGPQTPVAVVFTCSSGDFNGGLSYTEAFLRGGTTVQAGGAVASMGFCTPMTHTAYNNVVCGGFWSGMLDYQLQQVGTCMFRGKYDLYMTLPPGDSNVSSFSYWANLMGEPGMDMWCGVPGELTFEEMDDNIPLAPQVLALRVLDGGGQPVAGAAVCAHQADAFDVIGGTDADGRVWIEIPRPDAMSVQLTATRAWMVPARRTLRALDTVVEPVLESLAVADADGDGAWEAGETATLTATFHNPAAAGALPAFDVALTLGDPASGAVLQGAAALPALGPGASAAADAAFVVVADEAWTGGAPLELSFALEQGDEHHAVPALLALATPRIAIDAVSFQTGSLYPGESGQMRLILTNAGGFAGGEMPGVLSFPEGSGLTLPVAEIAVPTLAPGESTPVDVEVAADAGLVPGYTAPVTLAWGELADGPRGESSAAVTLGAQQAGDPTGPDAYGYYAYESTDTAWLQAPVYNWIEIAPNAGGAGQVVDLTDFGDEQDDTRRVALPFPFMVYGQVYESMAVCSNGFVAFGETADLESDFRNHFLPSGMGPEPMLAPMWDDHKLAGDAQVCVQHFPDSGLYVVEWYRMRTNSNNRINTFELILHDPTMYPTPTGDGDVIFQWETWDDTQNNSQDFPYCTVGLKDPSATVGLTLRNYQQEPSTVNAVGAGRAVRLTTVVDSDVEPAQLVLGTEAVEALLEPGAAQAVADSIVLGNAGGAPLSWQARVVQPEDWPPVAGGRDAGGPDADGYSWIDSEEPGGPAAGWVDVWDDSQPLEFGAGNDAVAGPVDLGFAIPFYGSSYEQVWISANGFVTFAQPSADYWQNSGGLPAETAPPLALLPYWDDLFNNDTPVADHVRMWTNGVDSLVVTWLEAPHYNGAAYGGPFTFQVVAEASGRVAFNYGDMAADDADSDSGTIGVTGDYPQGFQIRHMQATRDELTIRVRPPFWLALESATGLVGPGASGAVRLQIVNHVAGQVLPEGDYATVVVLSTNDPEQNELEIPVTLHVATVSSPGAALPAEFAVGEAWPNPFNPTTRVAFTLPAPAPVTARVYNLLGQEALRLLDGRVLPAGEHELAIDGSRLASGLYLLRVESLERVATRRLLLVK